MKGKQKNMYTETAKKKTQNRRMLPTDKKKT